MCNVLLDTCTHVHACLHIFCRIIRQSIPSSLTPLVVVPVTLHQRDFVPEKYSRLATCHDPLLWHHRWISSRWGMWNNTREGGREGVKRRGMVRWSHIAWHVRCRCVIAELFMDGRPLFDLSQLLEYYSNEKEATDLETTLKKIPDRFIRVSFHKNSSTCTMYTCSWCGNGHQQPLTLATPTNPSFSKHVTQLFAPWKVCTNFLGCKLRAEVYEN